jgi:hypothetical protein
MQSPPIPHTALKYEAQVTPDGRLDLPVPLPAGSRVTVFIVHQHEGDFADLVAASVNSLSFWDNPIDDGDWNDA